jgi:hypothetical protein
MANLKSMADSVASMGSRAVQAPTSEATGVKAKAANVKEYMDAVSGTTAAESAPSPNVTAPMDKINKGSAAKFGSRPGEKRLDVSEMTKPLIKYHTGTPYVPKTGPAILKKGEAVIAAEHNPMNPENLYDKVPGMMPKPKKEMSHMMIRKAKGGHVVEHHFTHPADHKMEEHVMTNMAALHNHLEKHMGTPNQGEESVAAGAPGAASADAPTPQVAGVPGA